MNCRLPIFALLIPFMLGACAAGAPPSASGDLYAETTSAWIDALPATDALILGEQHDADAHHRIEAEAVRHLAQKGTLAAVAMEMVERGRDTSALASSADEGAARQALDWNDKGWPWAAYGPVVMAAVRAGVPVIGANLPRSDMRAAMTDARLDGRLPGPALKAQQQAIRMGHCNLLPESQITPMTRVQIARDRTMADAVASAARRGKVVLLVAGAGHADRALGVPQHLPANLLVASVKLQAGDKADRAERFDAVWKTPALPEKDNCADVTPATSK